MSMMAAQLHKSVEEEPVVRPRRRTVASHDKYADARSTVERLSQAGLQVDEGAIIARGIRPLEHGRRRKIASMGNGTRRAFVADSFDVVVDVGIADRAASVLRQRQAIVIGPARAESAPDLPLGSPAR